MDTDAEIFRRSIRDPDAFREIFERHAAAVHAYARKRIGMAAGEEILAQTFLTAFEKRAHSTPRTHPHGRGCWGSPPTSSATTSVRSASTSPLSGRAHATGPNRPSTTRRVSTPSG